MNYSKKKWYQRTVWIIIFLIFFFPVGLFLMWKYSNWNKVVKGIVSVFLAFVIINMFFSPEVKPEEIVLSIPDYQTEYDINTNILLATDISPENNTSALSYHSTGKTITFSDSTFNTGTTEGTYEIYATAGGVKSNTISITVVDVAKEAEEKRLAEEKAAKEAEEKRLAEEKAAKEAEEKRLAEEKAAKEAEEKRLAEEKAAKEAEEKRLAEEKAAKEAEKSKNKTSGNEENFYTYDNAEQQNTSASYVLNTSTHKFHYPTCAKVKQIAPQNYATSNDSRDSLVAQGYDPCGICEP